MKVKELIEKLKKYNPEAELTVGDNFYNGISISYGYSDGCTEENCEYVCFDVDEKLCDNSERTTINLNGRSIQLESKTVKCKELQDYDYWREEDGTEVVKKIDNDESFSKTMEKYANMTQKEKELLLKDLSARLSYGVKGEVETTDGNGNDIKDEGVLNSVFIDEYGTAYICIEGMEYLLDDFKPYLRLLPSMTKKEKKEYDNLRMSFYKNAKDASLVLIDWLNAHHFDYRGLIPIGLAIEAPEGMY